MKGITTLTGGIAVLLFIKREYLCVIVKIFIIVSVRWPFSPLCDAQKNSGCEQSGIR